MGDDHNCLLFPVWLVTGLAKSSIYKGAVFSLVLLTFVYGAQVFGAPKNEVPTRIKRDGERLKTKPSGYHNRAGSPSRVARDEFYLLVPEEPKTDDALARRKVEASQLPKILSVLKLGNFAKAQQMLADLAKTMPVDSTSRTLYQRLATMCADRMDTEYWYRYDVKDMRNLKNSRQSIADVPRYENATAVTSPAPQVSTQAVHSLRKEAWMLLSTDDKTR